MKRPPRIKITFAKGPHGGAVIERLIAGEVYTRRVPDRGALSSTEAAKALGVTLRHLYNLVKDGKLNAQRKGDRLFFQLVAIKRYRDQKRRANP